MRALVGFLFAVAACAQNPAVGPALFAGTGLNDASSAGTPASTSANAVYMVRIATRGTPDRFTWSRNGTPASRPVGITASAQDLSDGVQIRFRQTTGHTVGDVWTIVVRANARDRISVLDFGAVPGAESTAAFERAFAAAGPGGHVSIPRDPLYPAVSKTPRCYLVSNASFLPTMVLEGDGEASCIQWNGQNSQLPLLRATNASHFTLRNFAVHCASPSGKGPADVGIYLTGGGGGLDAALNLVDGLRVDGCGTKNIELNKSYGWVFLNVFCRAGLTDGLHLDAGYNNDVHLIGGEFAANDRDGIHVEGGIAKFEFQSIAEGNGRDGLYMSGVNLRGARISGYFEYNGRQDIRIDKQLWNGVPFFDQPAQGVIIDGAYMHHAHAKTPTVVIYNAMGVKFSGNSTSMPYQPGLGPGTQLTGQVLLGSGVVNPEIDSTNIGFTFTDENGTPLLTSSGTVGENLLRYSDDLTRGEWGVAGNGAGCPGGLQACRDGARFLDGISEAWSIYFDKSNGIAHPVGLGQKLPGVHPGELVDTGIWVRTDAGAAILWISVYDDHYSFSGDFGPDVMPVRFIIGPNWQFVPLSAVTSSEENPTLTGITWRFFKQADSVATKVEVFAPQAATGVAGYPPRYIRTESKPVVKQLGPLPITCTSVSSPVPAGGGTPTITTTCVESALAK